MLGTADKVTVTKDYTTVVNGAGNKDSIKERCEQIKAQIVATKSDYDREKLQERLAKLSGGVAVLYVGAASEVEMKEKKDRVDDALRATRAAIEEGIIPGGGVAYIRAIDAIDGMKGDNADETTGVEIIKRAIEEPLRQIVANAGKEGAVVVQKVREGKGDFGYNARLDIKKIRTTFPNKGRWFFFCIPATSLPSICSIVGIPLYLLSNLLINREMLKVVTFMKQVARGLQMEGNFGTAHVYRSSLNAIIAYCGKEDFTFYEVSPEWLKGFEVHLRSRGCSWNTVSTYLRTFRAVYNRAVDLRKAPYVPNLFRSVYTGTRADHKRALGEEDIKKVFARLSQAFVGSPSLRKAQELFILMFLLRGLPFVDLAYLRKSDLRDNVITYRRRKTGRTLSVTLTAEAMILVKRYMNRDSSSPYLFSLLKSREGTPEAYREYQLALRTFS